MKNDAIWKLSVAADTHLSLIPQDLKYFGHRFRGNPVERPWIPPPVKITNKSKKLGDFVSWMNAAPVVSQRALEVMAPHVNAHVEFLPFHPLREKPYYAMNVLTIEDVLDYERSEVVYFDEDRKNVVKVKRYVFDTCGRPMPPIFKVEPERTSMFITPTLADVIISNKLTGINIVDPGLDEFHAYVNRRPIATYPGTQYSRLERLPRKPRNRPTE